ncbi:MAG: hypothetical protein E6G92_06625 [Alphaproteobacteria bacterium]|nr:MAG: hypothetical protein E6G92_06625 [Alphaproteobacteria bacterium]
MEPLRPVDIAKALAAGATEADLAEYNRLIAERFTTNPYLATSPEDEARATEREKRIGDLHQLLFSAVPLRQAEAPVITGEPPHQGLAFRLFNLVRERLAGRTTQV